MNKILFEGATLQDLLKEVGDIVDKKLSNPISESAVPPPIHFLSRKEVSKLLRISLPTLHEWTKSGILRSYRIGTRILYKLPEIEESLKHRNFKKTSKGGFYES